MSTSPYRVLPSLLLTGELAIPNDPECRALLFISCISQRLMSWEALRAFHRAYRARPLEWPRSFCESYGMLRLAVVMTEAFGEHAECPEVTRTLAYHLFDRDPHPELVDLIRGALPHGVSLLLSPSPELSS